MQIRQHTFGRKPLNIQGRHLRIRDELPNTILVHFVVQSGVESRWHDVIFWQKYRCSPPQVICEVLKIYCNYVLRLRGGLTPIKGISHDVSGSFSSFLIGINKLFEEKISWTVQLELWQWQIIGVGEGNGKMGRWRIVWYCQFKHTTFLLHFIALSTLSTHERVPQRVKGCRPCLRSSAYRAFSPNTLQSPLLFHTHFTSVDHKLYFLYEICLKTFKFTFHSININY